MDFYFGDVWLVRYLFQRGLGAIYLLAFIAALCQFPALLGERGLLPVPNFVSRVPFRSAPSLFQLRYSDGFFKAVAWLGILLSGAALTGLSEVFGAPVSAGVWLALWVAYLSIVNVGQVFYGFGWESMLLEAGFFACFLGPSGTEPSLIPVLALRWMLFRTELGAGLIKLRHDPCWRDLTCLYFHQETQPMPNPLSWRFHQLPHWVERCGVVFSHFVQVIVPLGLFLPQPLSSIAGGLIIAHQLVLIVSGNYAWLNWLTVVLAITAFSDASLRALSPLSIELPTTAPRGLPFDIALSMLAAATVVLSLRPTLNLFSHQQRMNHSYNPLHLVNDYGAFGSVSRERLEVVLEGAVDEAGTHWREYAFKGKPGDPKRRPPQIAPYHLRLDWLMWFLPLGGGHDLWFMRLVEKLLEGDKRVVRLLREDPFPNAPPRWIRARLYQYHYTSRKERALSGAFWTRELTGEYLRPVALSRGSRGA